MKKIAFMLLLLSGIVTTTNAQDLSKMSEKERNEYILKTAKEMIKTYAPTFRGYAEGDYEIEVIESNRTSPPKVAGYIVKFIGYDKEEEYFTYSFAVGVSFRIKDGRPTAVLNGNGRGIHIPEKPLTRGEEVPQLEYRRQPPFKLPKRGEPAPFH
jgi:ribosomal protein S17E